MLKIGINCRIRPFDYGMELFPKGIVVKDDCITVLPTVWEFQIMTLQICFEKRITINMFPVVASDF
jgi:hypothetical protein